MFREPVVKWWEPSQVNSAFWEQSCLCLDQFYMSITFGVTPSLTLHFTPQRFSEPRCVRISCELPTGFWRDLGWSLRIYTSNIFPKLSGQCRCSDCMSRTLVRHLCIFLAFLVMRFFLVGSLVRLICLQIFFFQILKPKISPYFHTFCSSRYICWDFVYTRQIFTLNIYFILSI